MLQYEERYIDLVNQFLVDRTFIQSPPILETKTKQVRISFSLGKRPLESKENNCLSIQDCDQILLIKFRIHNTHFKCSLKFQNTIKSSNNMTEPKLFFGHYGSLKKLQLLHKSVFLWGLYVHRFYNGFWLKNDILNFLKHFIF